MRVFGVASSDGTAAGLLPLTQRVHTWSSGHVGQEHLWLVGSTVRERQRWAAAPQGPQSVGDGLPTRSGMRLRILTTDTAKGSELLVDLGQSVELYAEAIRVELLAPAGSVALTDTAVALREGLVFDAQCMVRMLRLEASRGARSALLTQTEAIPANEDRTLEVPPAARRLTIYTELPAPAPQTTRWLRGDPSTMAIGLGVIAWDGDRPRTEIDVPSASHLRIDAHPEPRVFTLVWTIHP
ncbi:MAG: hypothetical protein KC501_32550 [Myxococcales bacterium]|nr:hypothetical protein [Myxococcales bacterium]